LLLILNQKSFSEIDRKVTCLSKSHYPLLTIPITRKWDQSYSQSNDLHLTLIGSIHSHLVLTLICFVLIGIKLILNFCQSLQTTTKILFLSTEADIILDRNWLRLCRSFSFESSSKISNMDYYNDRLKYSVLDS